MAASKDSGNMSTAPSQSSRASESSRFSNPDIFSDDFALEPLGYRSDPTSTSPDREHGDATTVDTPRRSLSLRQALESPTGSIRGSRRSQRSNAHSSISSRFDDRTSQSSNPPRSFTSISDSGNTASTQYRSTRTISTFGFPRAQSPYQGATGPSQPYGMYSQDIGVTRTPSAATSSTIRRPERSYSGPNQPTQPYGMYAQNTVPEDDTVIVAGLPPPDVAGYPGAHRNYQRRLGPDGEDVDDLVGPDGYTEQLPPYSRYANGVPPKYTSGNGSIDQRSFLPVPSEESQETLNESQPGNQDLVNPFGDSSTQLDSTASDAVPPKNETGCFKEKLKQRSKKKVCCGISCWLCVAIVLVVFLAVLLGGVIGGVVAHKRGEEKGMREAVAAQTVTRPIFPAAATATVTQMSPPPDATSLSSTPTNLPPLQTGTFAITLLEPTSITNSCLINTDQASAWDCATGAELSMEISMEGPDGPMVTLTYPESTDSTIRYGAQPPQLSGPANLMLVGDRDASNRGPAYLFQQEYNKTVIVHNSDLPGGLPGTKRSILSHWFSSEQSLENSAKLDERDTDDSEWASNSIAQPEDKPWYCYWPGTILEGFIYVTEDADQSASESAAYSTGASPNAVPSASSMAKKRQVPAGLPSYPKMVKIEERRNPFNPIKPYCQQMQILYTDQPGPLSYPSTPQLIQIQLQESEPVVQHQMQQQQGYGQGGSDATPSAPTSLPGRRRAIEKRTVTGSGPMCQCEWLSDS